MPRDTPTLRRLYPTKDDLCKAYNPTAQLTLCRDSRACHFGTHPTLAQLDAAYGAKAAAYWLVPQLLDLSEYCAARDKLTGETLKQCAEIIAQDYRQLKVTELMLFFRRFKAGRYGHFYAAIDPLVIAGALATFCRERADAHAERQRQEQDPVQRHDSARRQAVTYEEYRRRHPGTCPFPHGSKDQQLKNDNT